MPWWDAFADLATGGREVIAYSARGSEDRPPRLDVRRAVEQPLRGAEHGALAPRRGGELHADGDAERVEAGAHGAGRQAGQVLRRGVGHHQLAEGDLLTEMDEGLLADRDRRPGADG